MKIFKVKAGSEIKVRHIVGDTIHSVAKKLASGNYLFVRDSYVKGETCKDGFFHLRQAREVRPKKLGNNVKFWPRLRKACHVAGIQRINIPGGDIPIHYADEVVVPDFTMCGSHYFVVPKKRLGQILECLPLDEAGKQRQKEIWERRQYDKYSPKSVAEKLCQYFWYTAKPKVFPNDGAYEFVKISFHDWEGNSKSIIYREGTDIIHDGSINIAKIDTGLGFSLDAEKAARVTPDKYNRLRVTYCYGWHRDIAYLLPEAGSADVIADDHNWLSVFNSDKYENIFPKEFIVTSKFITFEFFTLDDTLISTLKFYTPELVAQAVPEREDVFIIDDAVRDEQGRIIGCRALVHI